MVVYKKRTYPRFGTVMIERVNEDGSLSYIPEDPRNADWIAYQKWLAEKKGNKAEDAQ